MASIETRENASGRTKNDLRNTDTVSGAANSIYATLAGEGPGEGPGEKHELGKGPANIDKSLPTKKVNPIDIEKPKLQIEEKQ